jgi:hypothetical protein
MHDFVADDMPESSAGGIERIRSKAIVPARSLCAGFNPTFGAQHFEVPADRGLWQLKDRPELVDTELIPLEGEQEPAPRRVGEGCHLPKEGGGGQMLNPFIRIKGYNNGGRNASSVGAAESRTGLTRAFAPSDR